MDIEAMMVMNPRRVRGQTAAKLAVTSVYFDHTILELNKNYVFVDYEKHVLCDSYIVEFVHDATGNYIERGKYGYKIFHVTKTLLFMLKF